MKYVCGHTTSQIDPAINVKPNYNFVLSIYILYIAYH